MASTILSHSHITTNLPHTTYQTPHEHKTFIDIEKSIDMVTENPASDGFVPPQNSPVRDVVDAMAATHKFKNLEIRDRSTPAEGGDAPDPMVITGQFERLDISGSSRTHMDNNSAQTTAAGRSHSHLRTKPVQKQFDPPIQHPAQPSELFGDSEDDVTERYLTADQIDEWRESIAAMQKKGKKRTKNASKRLSKGPIRNKIDGMDRHRQNASRKNPAN